MTKATILAASILTASVISAHSGGLSAPVTEPPVMSIETVEQTTAQSSGASTFLPVFVFTAFVALAINR